MSEKHTQAPQQEIEPVSENLAYVERSDGRIMPMYVIEGQLEQRQTFGEGNVETTERLFTVEGVAPEWIRDPKSDELMWAKPRKQIVGSLLDDVHQQQLEKKLSEKLYDSVPRELQEKYMASVGLKDSGVEKPDYIHGSTFHVPEMKK